VEGGSWISKLPPNSGNKKMKVGIGYSSEADAFQAGKQSIEKAIRKSDILQPDIVFAFCNGSYDHDKFIKGIQVITGEDVPVIGGSAVGILTNEYLSYDGFSAGVAVIRLDGLEFRLSTVNDLDKNEKRTGEKLAKQLLNTPEDKIVLLFYDSIRVPAAANTPPVLNNSTNFLEGFEQNLTSAAPVLGAGLLGDLAFGNTKLFCGSHVSSQCAAGLAISGEIDVYHRIMHGCSPLDGIYHTITKIDGPIVYELDGIPITQIIDEIYGNKNWRSQQPVKQLALGVNYGKKFDTPKETNYVTRLINCALQDGEGIVLFESDFKEGTEIQIMLRSGGEMIESTRRNTTQLINEIQTDGKKAIFGFYIDCAGRASVSSSTQTEEASEVQKIFNARGIPLLGFYSGVEIAPFLGKSQGLDWTGVLIVFAER